MHSNLLYTAPPTACHSMRATPKGPQVASIPVMKPGEETAQADGRKWKSGLP